MLFLFPKDPFVRPKKGNTPIESYEMVMGMEPSILFDRNGFGFLGVGGGRVF